MGEEKKFKDAFKVFVTDGTEIVNVVHLGTMLRAVGLNPPEKAVNRHLKESEASNLGFLDLPTFVEIAKKCKKEEKTIEVLIESFKTCDKENKGTISMAEMKYLLTRLGDSISEEEFQEILNDAGLEDKGDVDYKNFVEFLYQQDSLSK